MGLTICNKYGSIDIGYGGFFNLRKNIAGIYSKEFADLYENWCRGKIKNDEGNKKLQEFFDNGILKDDDELVLDFLFASDCKGKLDGKTCRKLYHHIKDYDDDILYGYVGRPDCAKFKDFKDLVESSYRYRSILRWS